MLCIDSATPFELLGSRSPAKFCMTSVHVWEILRDLAQRCLPDILDFTKSFTNRSANEELAKLLGGNAQWRQSRASDVLKISAHWYAGTTQRSCHLLIKKATPCLITGVTIENGPLGQHNL